MRESDLHLINKEGIKIVLQVGRRGAVNKQKYKKDFTKHF